MGANVRMVKVGQNVTTDKGTNFVPAGAVVDCPAGSAMETAYGGAGNLQALTTAQLYSLALGSDQRATSN
jgi:hypothetical protein